VPVITRCICWLRLRAGALPSCCCARGISPSLPDMRRLSHWQVVAICGRNAKLLQRLRAKGSPNGLVLLATGFVDNLHEWMAAADVIVTKAGPGTIAEALISGLPILLNGNIPCQEEGNIPYVIDNKVGGAS
jgi:1,2-diacylglycerol 3-beta-galactosyltransferase